MATASAILGFLVAIVPLVLALLEDWIARREPAEVKRDETIAKQIADGRAGRAISNLLRRLRLEGPVKGE
jgi:hypothetical protein